MVTYYCIDPLPFCSTAVTIGFTQPTYSVSETDVYVEVCVSANGADFARTVMVTLSTEDGTAIGKCTCALCSPLPIPCSAIGLVQN